MDIVYVIITVLVFSGLAIVFYKKNKGHHHCNRDCENCLHPCLHGRSRKS